MRFCLVCDSEFEPSIHVQVYCSAHCREIATKQKIIEGRYRKRLRSKPRLCAGGCGTMLSIYNDSNMCDSCSINRRQYRAFLQELKQRHEKETN